MHLNASVRMLVLIGVVGIASARAADSPPQPPEDFPHFIVPGFDQEMSSLRDLYWEHYARGGPMATLWDEWLSGPTLWPAVATDDRMDKLRKRWRDALRGRVIDAEGYVATHQHASIAHQQGWPFPFWGQGGPGAWGWHFSLAGVPKDWHNTSVKSQDGWTVTNGHDLGVDDLAWKIELSAARTAIQAPPVNIDVLQAPFLQLRWRATGLGDAQPYVEWTTADAPDFSPARRMYFAPVESQEFVYTMIPVHRHPQWTGHITSLRVQFGNAAAGGTVGIQALFTQYDTRHNVNNQCFIKGCWQYFCWTRDISFLRDQIQRMRLALHYLMTECHGRQAKCIVTPFVGHDGRSGLQRDADGTKHLLFGRGIGGNYWDLLPLGRRDAYATMLYYDALLRMADLERAIVTHSEWNIPAGPLRLDADDLERHAREVRAANTGFWNATTERFTLGVDDDGQRHDYGFTFMNLEAVYYDYASPEQAAAIMSWITGQRQVEGDTSQGADIYRWRFAPRSTTRRNVDYYGWFWSSPESIPWGGQVQDGGAVLGFSYHDLMARLKVLGPDDAWTRLREIITWYREVQAAGGPRTYYKSAEGTLQGGGTAGGLGIDREFYESVMVPHVILQGFLGFKPTPTGARIMPRLPSQWPEVTVDRIHFHDRVVRIRATTDMIEMMCITGIGDGLLDITLPPGEWTMELLGSDNPAAHSYPAVDKTSPAVIGDEWTAGSTLRFTRRAPD